VVVGGAAVVGATVVVGGTVVVGATVVVGGAVVGGGGVVVGGIVVVGGGRVVGGSLLYADTISLLLNILLRLSDIFPYSSFKVAAILLVCINPLLRLPSNCHRGIPL
jgi:hypothetical protein